ncbi:MAG TPA: O-antigen ligase family protein [Caulobacteraceae bacterium]|nr:O-antigen ligase family protein [Caulobacteraceae bacterium]
MFAGHLAFGANRTNLALGFSTLWFVLLALMLFSQDWAARALNGMGLRAAGAGFACVLLLAVLSLTPFGLGGAHPIWSFVPGAPAVVSVDPYATLVEIVKLLALAAAFLIGCCFGADDDRAKGLIRAILVVGIGFSAWAFIDHIASPDLLFGGPRPSGPDRLSAAFGSSNTAATLFGALTLLNLIDLVRTYDGARPRGRFHGADLQPMISRLARPLLALVLAATCLILTFSRGGMAATAGVGVVLLGATALARSRPTAISAPVIATVSIVGGLLLGSLALNIDALQQRFLFFGPDALTRGQIFAAHWSAFLAAPWSGYGLGSFARINAMIMDTANLAALGTLGAAHNVYIQWLEEAGVLGAAAMFATIAVLAVQLAIGVVRRRRMRSWLLAIFAVLLLFLLHGASDYALQTPSMALFLSLLLGVGIGVSGSPAPAPVKSAPGEARRERRRGGPRNALADMGFAIAGPGLAGARTGSIGPVSFWDRTNKTAAAGRL